ncbi:phosphate ABC transporter substrate-binding protein [Romboutsia lituseburensis]|uniref:phosphate ABC transporter substrate-binding protein n=1 Tax=Romboutsia lituseburensis TaxID=1537 RepID=UPI00215B0810|nr:phosphate ABC transporter substrate-binding protein [Romboutsia lituseburensis]MCR8744063.1 phosphate ABC transporter substrate-binding protein [Romboutsia lituseburensis]
MKSKKLLVVFFNILLVLTMAVGCGKSKEQVGSNVTISGSTSVGPLIEKEAESFKKSNSDISVEVNQLGSSAGIKDAINGTVQVGMSSRDLKEEEKNAGLKEVEIAYDGISVITNKANAVNNLTIAQIKDIYTGKIINWKDIGGKDAPIVVVSREDGSGTRDAFQEIVGYKSEELTKDAQIGDGSGNIKSTVTTNENAVGFISFEYIDDSINSLNVDSIEPNAKNVLDGKYKISRPFLLVYKEDKGTEQSKKFIDFILSEEGQKIVEENGLIKIK